MPLIDIIRNKRRPLLVFEHGLGDLICFLPVFYEFVRQTKIRPTLGASSKRQFHLITKDIVNIRKEDSSVKAKYDFIYKINYPDSSDPSMPLEYHDDPAKPYLCAHHEFGIKHFTWKPFIIPNKWYDENSKRVGFHFFGHTGMMDKFCPRVTAEQIWKETIKAGYEPFECHMRPQFAKEYKDAQLMDQFNVVNKSNSLRFEEPDLSKLMEEIGKCKFFIGIDSGPIYLAGSIIGTDRLIGLTNKKLHNQFYPKHLQTVSVISYVSGTIYNIIKRMEKWL